MSSEEDPGPVSSVSRMSQFEKGQIVGAYLGGLSVKDVSQMCNVSCHAVSEILDVYKLYLDLTPGHKRKSGTTVAMETRKRRKEARIGETEDTPVNQTKETDTQRTGIGSKARSSNEDGKEK